uniref:ABC transporter domain-containing protein n=1 Tax=Oryza meridionalis TaxID=40149 RepID=A0A0E0EC82_9ORYZ
MAGEITPSGSQRSWLSSGAASLARSLRDGDDPFRRSAAASRRDAGDDEENLRWAALEKLPTYDRMRRGILRKAVDGGDGEGAGSLFKADEVDIANLDPREGRELMERVFKAIEVRYQHLDIEADVHVGKRALPTLLNATINTLEGLVSLFISSNKRKLKILNDVNGIIKPSRMTLLLGPPSSGKSTLMRALTGKPDKNLKPPPETYALFDDIVLIAEGYIVYHGPRENILEFFESAGFRCPERKGVADFLQEVTSRKDQQQYWFLEQDHYRYVSVEEFAQNFKKFHVGQKLQKELQVPYDKSKTHPAALTTKKYGLSSLESLKAVMSREWLLMKRNSFLFIFKAFQLFVLGFITMTLFLRTKMPHEKFSDTSKYVGALTASLITIMFNGFGELQLTIDKLPIFYKQRDFLFFPAWTYGLANIILKVPLSLMESSLWIVLTYYVVGFAPAAGRFFKQFLAYFWTHQMALALFRLLGAILRSMVVANTFGMFVLLLIFLFGGFLVSRKDIKPWWIWGYWTSPMMYSNNALSVNEFLASRWAIPNNDSSISAPTIGKAFLQSKGYFTGEWGYWLSIGAMIGFMIVFNILYLCALTFLRPIGSASTVVSDDDTKSELEAESNQEQMSEVINGTNGTENRRSQRGMVLPFQPLSLSFNHMNYYVDMPAEMKAQGFTESRLQLLSDISGAFRPGVLTALVGVSGAGKTTLMDVLAGRKTSGTIEGDIKLSGYPKKQETFARISGYCEQTDIHSPNLTVYESIVYSAWLRLSSEVDKNTRKVFVEEVMSLVELDVLRDALVGLPGVSGLSTEQRKRLTIAVELVANPSIIFMDEPTSGLDARAAAIVMRTVRNTVNTGRTVVCTIHQPSIDIFESFDELLLLKRGGRVIYAGQLGLHSQILVEYFEAIPGVPKITEGYNPATWMLEVSSSLAEARLDIDFAEVYANSALYRSNQELIKQLSVPPPGFQDLSFPTKYSQNFLNQCVANTWKQFQSYWKDPPYNAMRYVMTLLYGLVFGTVFWRRGKNIESVNDLNNLLGATYAAVFFLGAANLLTLLPVVSVERTVFYREKAAGMYSPLSYAFAQGFVEFCYSAVQGVLYTILIYSMIGYEWKADKFFYFLFFMIAAFAYFTLFSMMLVACTASEMLAAVLVSFVLSSWNNFAGFIIPRPLIPVWWRWFYWANPVSWTIYGVIASQFADSDRVVTVPGQATTMVVKDFLEKNMGFKHDFLGYVVLAHFGYVIIFFFLFGYGIKCLNFQKR